MFSNMISNLQVKKIFLIIMLSLGILSLCSCRGSSLQQWTGENTFVYAVTLNDLTAIRSALIPPNVDSIYMLSDILGIISPRQTRVYYWPLTNRYLADWNTLNTLIEGDLEVLEKDDVVEVIPLQDYVIQYDTNNVAESLAIHIGEKAGQMYQVFKTAQLEYQQAMFDYYDERKNWIEEMDELYKKLEKGETVGEFPMEPDQPPPFTFFSTEVIQGYPINLPEGEYSIRMKLSDGSSFPESIKDLIIFKARKISVTYDVIPETRWTKPAESYNPSGVLYVTPGTEIYMKPYQGSEYRDLYFTNMLDPQDDTGRLDRWQWVPQFPLSGVTMRISYEGSVLRENELQPFYVKQTSGSSLSYEVVPYDPESMNQISFEGFMIGTIEGYKELQVVLLDEEGNKLPGSERLIRLINVDRGKYLYPLSTFPLIIGLVIVFYRRQKTKSIQTPK